MDQGGLHQLEEQCIQEHAPACMATCPARVDVRSICSEIEKGDYAAGYKILRKAVPFPGIISRICDQPCRSACIRKDVGEAISIASLERACSDFVGERDNLAVLPKRDQKLAVIGSGLCGLTVAYDLARKGYQVTVFEKLAQPGGSIREIPENVLPPRVIEKDFSVINSIGIEIKLNTKIEKITSVDENMFQIENETFDAVFIGTGSNPSPSFGLEKGHSAYVADPVTYQSSIPGIFCGGKAIASQGTGNPQSDYSPITSISDGHRAATSIDRFFQNVSMSASRIREGSYETRLYTSLNGIPASNAVNAKDDGLGYSSEEARQEAARCLQCQCLECVKVCEYLKEYGSYPKRYVREIYNNLSIVKGERKKNQFINSCSLCGLCGEVCPTDLDMGTVCLESRREMVSQNRMPPSAHDFALRDMQFANSDKCALVRSQPGTTSTAFLFFPGCQLSASNPQYVEKIYEQLRELPEIGSAGVGLALRCCGAPAEWAGREDLFEQSKSEFLGEYQKLGKPEVVLACSSCYRMFQKYYPEIPIKSLWSVLNDSQKAFQSTAQNSPSLAIHDACSTRYETEIQDNVRSLVSNMGYRIEELPYNRENTECCGYGGHMWLANPPLAKKAAERRINESPLAYITYCVMCRDLFLKQGKASYHILDLLFSKPEELFNSSIKPPDYSTRHENRAKLKQKLLQELWGETMPDASEIEGLKLNITDEVRTIMEERHILAEDLQQVIAHARKTGMVLYNRNNDHILAYYCPTYVTYWVEFTKEEDAYRIHNTYSHRMKVDEGTQS